MCVCVEGGSCEPVDSCSNIYLSVYSPGHHQLCGSSSCEPVDSCSNISCGIFILFLSLCAPQDTINCVGGVPDSCSDILCGVFNCFSLCVLPRTPSTVWEGFRSCSLCWSRWTLMHRCQHPPKPPWLLTRFSPPLRIPTLVKTGWCWVAARMQVMECGVEVSALPVCLSLHIELLS